MRRLGPQRDAVGYLACHDVGVNASEPSGRTRADRSRSARQIAEALTRHPQTGPHPGLHNRMQTRGCLTADIAYNIASSSSMLSKCHASIGSISPSRLVW